MITLDKMHYLTKWQSTLICLERLWKIGLLAMC